MLRNIMSSGEWWCVDICIKLTSARPDLTVEEHIRIFSDLKCLSETNDEVINELAQGVDLQKKLKKKAKTLSGGQKRKLQMAIMFAGKDFTKSGTKIY